ncbi:TFIIB-type zinc ribbon-containing protein [Sphingobium cloacae]|nr:zf-TFIIB domain-containing protein [Sphingobium cloacae]
MSERQGIEIDYCPQCRGVWLDRGELDKIIERSVADDGVRPLGGRLGMFDEQRGHGDQHGHGGHGGKHGYERGGHGRRKGFLRELFD